MAHEQPAVLVRHLVSGHTLDDGALALFDRRDVAVYWDFHGVTTAATGTW